MDQPSGFDIYKAIIEGFLEEGRGLPVARIYKGTAHAVYAIKTLGSQADERNLIGWYAACEDVGIAAIRAGGQPYTTLIPRDAPEASIVTCMFCIAAGED